MNTETTVENTIPVIDWDALFCKSNNKTAAKKLLGLFMAQLPDGRKDVNRYTKAGNLFKLDETLHKLLGGCIYCCVPRFQEVLEDFNQVVVCMGEVDRELLQIYLDEFNEQTDALLAAYQEKI
jgi:hypothetical protein